jgi:hypothetical protein
MKQYLEETGLFEVDIYRAKYTWKAETEKRTICRWQVWVRLKI